MTTISPAVVFPTVFADEDDFDDESFFFVSASALSLDCLTAGTTPVGELPSPVELLPVEIADPPFEVPATTTALVAVSLAVSFAVSFALMVSAAGKRTPKRPILAQHNTLKRGHRLTIIIIIRNVDHFVLLSS